MLTDTQYGKLWAKQQKCEPVPNVDTRVYLVNCHETINNLVQIMKDTFRDFAYTEDEFYKKLGVMLKVIHAVPTINYKSRKQRRIRPNRQDTTMQDTL
jgi:hypothetical protein